MVVCVRHHENIVALSVEWPERDDPQHLFLIGQSHTSGEGRGTTGSAAGLLPVPQLHWPMTDSQNKDISGRKMHPDSCKHTVPGLRTRAKHKQQWRRQEKINLICMSFQKKSQRLWRGGQIFVLHSVCTSWQWNKNRASVLTVVSTLIVKAPLTQSNTHYVTVWCVL